MSLPPRLQIEGLLADADGKPIEISIARGECAALLTSAPSQASLLVDQVAGHERTGRARIRLDGHDVSQLAPGSRRIGLASPRDPLFGQMSVCRNLEFPLFVKRMRKSERRHRVQAISALLGIDALADLLPAKLDAAQRLRVSLGRLLVSDPCAIVLDNPLAQLSTPCRRDLHQLLRRLLRARGIAMLLLTGDREEAMTMGSQIGILDGRILHQLASASELLDRPADQHVAIEFGLANCLTGTVEAVEDDIAQIRLAAEVGIEAMDGGGLLPGMACVVCIRPERIAVAFASTEQAAFASEALRARLLDLVQLGDHVSLRFRLAGGMELRVNRPASQPVLGLRPDQPALLAWQTAHAVAFPLP